MKTTRQRLLDYLEIHKVATAAELSRSLQVTPADIRHHLALLRKEGLVETAGERPPQGRGRPAGLFRLSRQLLGENLSLLAGALLAETLEGKPEAERRDLLKRIAARLAGERHTAGHLSQRLFLATRRLIELQYKARWEAHSAAPQVIFGHCPYAAILREHPELCQMDADLLETLLDAPAVQTAKLERDARGATYCKFQVIAKTAG